MSDDLAEAVASAEGAAAMAEAFALYPKAYKAAEKVIEASANGESLAEALGEFADLASQMSDTVALVDDPKVKVHAEFMRQVSRAARAASRYYAVRFSAVEDSVAPSIRQQALHIRTALGTVQKKAQEVMDSEQGTAVSLFASAVKGWLSALR